MIAEHHQKMLEASGIPPEQVEARGYETVTDPQRLADLRIVKAARGRVPGLLIPMLDARGSVWGHQYRPDVPRLREGKPVKYETPWEQCNGLDIPPGVGDWIGDPTVPLWVTEGVKKADCAAQYQLCIVALTGVWNWRGTNGMGGKTAVADWNDIALNGRLVVLAFDGDVARKKNAAKALCALADYLKFRGATVKYLHLPDEDEKVGLDDWLTRDGHTKEDLWKLVKPEQPPIRNHPDLDLEAVRARLEGSAPRRPDGEQAAAEDGSRFFGHSGLLARDLADAVMHSVTCGFGHPDQRFYTYDRGVWVLNEGRIEAEITRLLGNHYRTAHTRTVLDLIRYSQRTVQVSDNPLADYVNVPNGMVAWKTGDLVAHSPDYRSTVQLPVEYDPKAECPLFEKFVAEVLPPDLYEPAGDSLGFIWELIGYTLYSGNPLHVAVLLYGKGRNGKGTLIRVLKALLGDRNCSTVGLHQLLENRFRAATLFRKLANLAGDLDPKWLDNTAIFKAITGGDTIQAEHKYGTPFDFTPWALPFYSINKAFGSADSSEGWVARWVVVPFPTSFYGREDRTLDAKLQTGDELRGILRRGIEALPALMARGRFAEPESLREAKAAFVVACDAVRAWLDECCVLGEKEWTERKELYAAYRMSTLMDNAKVLSKREFYNRIEQVSGICVTTIHGVRGFSGVRPLKDGESQSQGAPEGAEQGAKEGTTHSGSRNAG